MHANRLLLCVAGFAAFASIHAAEPAKPASPLTFSGDLRLRYENDWDSHTTSGAARIDRQRWRVRARAGLTWKISDELTFGARFRTGSRGSQQSPHLTFTTNDGATDPVQGGLDRYYLQLKKDSFTGWIGRNTTPFWQQNEMYWDEDVTPTGAAGTVETKLDQGSITTTAGAFFMPDGLAHLNGTLVGAQVKYTRPIKPAQFTLAGSFYHIDGHSGATYLRNRNGVRDYVLGVLSAQWSAPAGGLPLTLGVDLIHNFSDYTTADTTPFADSQAGETDGYVFSLLYGQLKNPRDWQVGYYYAHIETFAVNAAYGQDDWARFGSGPQADVTDFKGHEFRATYQIAKNLNVQARLFFVEAITSVQDGKRLRIDLNWKF